MNKVKVEITNNQKKVKIPTGIRLLIRRCCHAVLELEGFTDDAEVSVSFVDNEQIRKINKEYRNIDKETDVISFPLGTDGNYDVNMDTGAKVIGDIVISMEKAFEQAFADGFYGTDDAGLTDRIGVRAAIVEGEYENIKITTPEDLKMEYRIGTGYDVHRLEPDRKLVLGGVCIPFEKGLLGHSDADVLVHALMDAMLGAAGLGDIGKLFPDSDPAYSGISSILLLEKTGKAVSEAGYCLGNADITVICQRPRLAPYIEQMRENIAAALTVPKDRISIKATTTEKLGFTGRGEGIASEAVCLLNR